MLYYNTTIIITARRFVKVMWVYVGSGSDGVFGEVLYGRSFQSDNTM